MKLKVLDRKKETVIKMEGGHFVIESPYTILLQVEAGKDIFEYKLAKNGKIKKRVFKIRLKNKSEEEIKELMYTFPMSAIEEDSEGEKYLAIKDKKIWEKVFRQWD